MKGVKTIDLSHKQTKKMLRKQILSLILRVFVKKLKKLSDWLFIALIILIASTIIVYFTQPKGKTSSIQQDRKALLLLEKTNEEREQPLIINQCLEWKAIERAKQIVDTGLFSHEDKTGKMPYVEMIDSCGEFKHLGENLAIDFKTIEEMHKALMDSPTHKHNILGDYELAGYGCYDNVCVQFFAK